MRYLQASAVACFVPISVALARGPASTTAYGGGGGDGALLLILVLAGLFYWFITSRFGMTLVLFLILAAIVVAPLLLLSALFQKGSAIEIVAYGSMVVSLYWGPLVSAFLPDDARYPAIKEFAGVIWFQTLIGLLAAAFVGGILALVFDSEEARAVGVLGTLVFIYVWASREKDTKPADRNDL